MCYELKEKGYKIQKEVVRDVLCEHHVLGYIRADIIVNNEYVIKVKSIEKIKEINQVVGYLDLFNMKMGYIININHKKYEIISVGARTKPYVKVEEGNERVERM